MRYYCKILLVGIECRSLCLCVREMLIEFHENLQRLSRTFYCTYLIRMMVLHIACGCRLRPHTSLAWKILEDMLAALYKLIQLKLHFIFTPEAYNHANQAVQTTFVAPH